MSFFVDNIIITKVISLRKKNYFLNLYLIINNDWFLPLKNKRLYDPGKVILDSGGHASHSLRPCL